MKAPVTEARLDRIDAKLAAIERRVHDPELRLTNPSGLTPEFRSFLADTFSGIKTIPDLTEALRIALGTLREIASNDRHDAFKATCALDEILGEDWE